MVVVFALLMIAIGLATDGLVSSISQLVAFIVLLVATAIKVRSKKTDENVH